MPNLKGMNVEALMKLRNQVDERLLSWRSGSAWELPSRSSATCCTGSAHDGAQHIEADQVRLGPEEGQGLVGLPRSRVERNSMIF
jgi:hypothetical protein